MLQLIIPPSEMWDEEKEEFVRIGKEQKLQLEHSLVSISKWESKWHKSYIHSKDKTPDEIIDYVRCMTLTQNVDPEVYDRLTAQNINDIADYISNPMTATTFAKDEAKPSNKEILTAELLYYYMVAFNIPFECQKWHLNRLLTLINVCSVKNQPPKKMSKKAVMNRNAALNAARKRQLQSRG